MLERGGTGVRSGTKDTAEWAESSSRRRGLVFPFGSASPLLVSVEEAAADPFSATASSPHLRMRRRRSLHFCAIRARTFTGFTPKRWLILASGGKDKQTSGLFRRQKNYQF